MNSINPSFIDTDFQSKVRGIERDGEEYLKILEVAGAYFPIGRYENTQDCVNVIAFLVNDSSNFITGTNLVIDGGVTNKSPENIQNY